MIGESAAHCINQYIKRQILPTHYNSPERASLILTPSVAYLGNTFLHTDQEPVSCKQTGDFILLYTHTIYLYCHN